MTEPPPPAATLQPDPQAPLHRRLIDCSIDILETAGLDALTLRAAARAAGVSHMAPYRHFTDKNALLAAVAEAGYRDLAATLEQAGASGLAPGPRLHEIGLAYINFALRRPALYRLMFGPATIEIARYPALAAAADRAFGAYAGVLAPAVAGPISGTVFPGPAISIATWSLVHGLASLLIDGRIPVPDAPGARQTLIAEVLLALRSAAPPPPVTPFDAPHATP